MRPWKIVAIVLALAAAGHLAVRYLPRNPLGPSVDGGEVVVTSQDYEVRFARNGPVKGSYFVFDAESRDFSDRPLNAVLWVIDADAARDYSNSYPDFHLYGSDSSERLRDVAGQIAVVAATSPAYADLRALVAEDDERATMHGERLCVTLIGTSLTPESAASLDSGDDDPTAVQRLIGDTPVVFADKVKVADCVKMLHAPPPPRS